MNSPHEEARSSPLRAAIVAVAIRSFTANAAQQSERDEHENDEQNGADDEPAVIAINAVLSDVIVGGVEVTERIVAGDVRRRVDLLRECVADVLHRLPDFVY